MRREGGKGTFTAVTGRMLLRDSEQIVPGNFVPAISALGGFQRYLGILSWGGRVCVMVNACLVSDCLRGEGRNGLFR